MIFYNKILHKYNVNKKYLYYVFINDLVLNDVKKLVSELLIYVVVYN